MSIQERQVHPKTQPRRPKPNRGGFSATVKETVLRRSGGVCELDSCGPLEHYHHRAPRGRGGTSLDWINRAGNALGLAARCHDRVERNRTSAYENGWLIPRNQRNVAVEIPVLYRGRWVHLTDYGLIVPTGDGAA